MQVAGQMNGAAAADGVPAGWVSHAKKLGLKADLGQGPLHRDPLQPLRQIPGGAAGRPPKHLNTPQAAICYSDPKCRFAEAFAISAQTDLPGQGASSGRGQDSRVGRLFSRCHDGDGLGCAQDRQIEGEVRVSKEIQDQVGLQMIGQVNAAIVDDGWKGRVDADRRQAKRLSTVHFDAGELGGGAVTLDKGQHALGRLG